MTRTGAAGSGTTGSFGGNQVMSDEDAGHVNLISSKWRVYVVALTLLRRMAPLLTRSTTVNILGPKIGWNIELP